MLISLALVTYVLMCAVSSTQRGLSERQTYHPERKKSLSLDEWEE